MAKLDCNLKEFTYFVDPRIRNNVATMTKQSKSKLEYKCQKCGEKKELEAAHKHGSSRKEIIRDVLSKYSTSDEQYEIDDLQKVIDEINNAHLPIEDHFRFLCKTCHREYDSWTKNMDSIKSKEKSLNNTTIRVPSKKIISNDKDGSIIENMSERETQNWRYKIDWTSIENKRNIEELILMIESNLECYPAAIKSWYYHNRKDNNRQFSGIICHKNRSEICFRVDDSFNITDSRIIHDKRWFFQKDKEKRISIIPENYELIIQCLHYAYKISR